MVWMEVDVEGVQFSVAIWGYALFKKCERATPLPLLSQFVNMSLSDPVLIHSGETFQLKGHKNYQ